MPINSERYIEANDGTQYCVTSFGKLVERGIVLKHPRVYATWTKAEKEMLLRFHGLGRTVDDIAELLGRTVKATDAQLADLLADRQASAEAKGE